jgi:hypothetical protein
VTPGLLSSSGGGGGGGNFRTPRTRSEPRVRNADPGPGPPDDSLRECVRWCVARRQPGVTDTSPEPGSPESPWTPRADYSQWPDSGDVSVRLASDAQRQGVVLAPTVTGGRRTTNFSTLESSTLQVTESGLLSLTWQAMTRTAGPGPRTGSVSENRQPSITWPVSQTTVADDMEWV